MSLFFQIKHFLIHKIKSGDSYSIHSPFLFEFYNQTVAYPKQFYAFQELSKIRKKLQRDKSMIQIVDLGAGSKKNKSNKRSISDIANTSLKPKFITEFLFKLINFIQPNTTVELGTSLGLTTLYLSKACCCNKIYTFEGCTSTLSYAEKVFKSNSAENIKTVLGNIDEQLPKNLSAIEKLDFVFFDANHTYDATIQYFKWCVDKIDENTVFVFDDIYWSAEMHKAWREIISDNRVMLSIDFYYLGVIFFRKNQPKQHFYLKL